MFKTAPHTHCTLLLAFLLLSMASCDKLEVPQSMDGTGNEPSEEARIYTVGDILLQDYPQGGTADIWLEGYIVGHIPGNDLSQAVFDKGSTESNILMADTPTETDPRLCVPVQLTTSSNDCRKTREALNLADNPAMLHQHVRLCGSIASYMGTKGLLRAHQYTLLPAEPEDDPTTPETPSSPEIPENPEPPEDPEPPENPEPPEGPVPPAAPTLQDTIDYVNRYGDSEETAFTVDDLRGKIPTFFSVTGASGIPSCYVCGYIVGYIPKNYNDIAHTVFAAGDTQTNIVIADSPDETDYHRCIAVQLSTGTPGQKEVREGLNLSGHPQNLRAFIVVCGHITQYMGAIGVKSVNTAVIEP